MTGLYKDLASQSNCAICQGKPRRRGSVRCRDCSTNVNMIGRTSPPADPFDNNDFDADGTKQ